MIKRRTPIKKISDKKLAELGGKMPFSTIKKSDSGIRKVSPKRKSQNELYSEVRKEYLLNHAKCELFAPIMQYRQSGENAAWWPICGGKSCEIHHMKSRIGSLLTNPDYFKAACDSSKNLRSCHHWVTEFSRQAIEIGLSISRLKD